MKFFVFIVVLAVSGCRLFGGPSENNENNQNNANNANNENNQNNQNNLNNQNNDQPDMPVVTVQPVLPQPMPSDPRIEQGRLFEFRFTEGSGTETRNLTGDLVADLSPTVTWLPDRNGVAFAGDGLISTRTPPTTFFERVIPSQRFTIEAWVRPQDGNTGVYRRVATISATSSERNIQILQHYDYWMARMSTSVPVKDDIRQPDPVEYDAATHLVATYDGTMFVLYVNGTAVIENERFGSLNEWDTTYRLAFGNELTEDRGWTGDIYLIAAYDRAFSPEEVQAHFQLGDQF